MNKDLLTIPRFVSAGSPEELERAMLQVNFQTGKANKYFDIQQAGNRWYAWYLANAKELVSADVRARLEGRQ